MTAAVLLPALLAVLGAERFFFSVADGLHAICRNPCSHKRVLDRTGAVIAQGEIVFGGSALVAVSFNRERDVRMLLQECGVSLNGRLLISANIRLVVIKVDVLNVLREHLLVSHRRLCWR